MRKTYKYRLYPNSSQRFRLNRVLELCRWVYNETITIRKETWEQNQKSLTKYDTMKMLPIWKLQKPELKEVHSQVLQNVCERVDFAFRAFFRRLKNKEKPGYPRYKGEGRYDSFTYPQNYHNSFSIRGNKLHLSKIGDIKIRLHRPIEGQIKRLSIKRDTLGNWYACFSCIVEPRLLPVSQEMVGIDLGLSQFAALSNGEIIERQRWIKRDEKNVKKIQSKIDKSKRNFKRKKLLRAFNHIHQRIVNRRKDFAHKLSRKLVNRFGLIAFEKLDIQNMQANNFRAINSSIEDVAWSQFVQFTFYKAEEAGRSVVSVDPKNTSQKCSNCNLIVKKDLSVRTHDCPNCGLEIDRDINAARNILALGLQGFGVNP